MARVNVYIPDDLAKRAKVEGLNVSALTQTAIAATLAAKSTDIWLKSLTRGGQSTVSHLAALQAIDAEREDAPTRHG
jgi:post-segregation antitoxin (ccd killing protein)